MRLNYFHPCDKIIAAMEFLLEGTSGEIDCFDETISTGCECFFVLDTEFDICDRGGVNGSIEFHAVPSQKYMTIIKA